MEGGRGLPGAGQAPTPLILSGQMWPIKASHVHFNLAGVNNRPTTTPLSQPTPTFQIPGVESATGTPFVLPWWTLSGCCLRLALDSCLHSVLRFLPWPLNSMLVFILTLFLRPWVYVFLPSHPARPFYPNSQNTLAWFSHWAPIPSFQSRLLKRKLYTSGQ